MASALTCRKLPSLGEKAVYVWKTGDGAVGNILIDTEEAVARPCTPQGIVVGDMLLREGVGNIEQPDSDPEVRRCFLIAASVIFQEWRRQGLLPEEITRTYW